MFSFFKKLFSKPVTPAPVVTPEVETVVAQPEAPEAPSVQVHPISEPVVVEVPKAETQPKSKKKKPAVMQAVVKSVSLKKQKSKKT